MERKVGSIFNDRKTKLKVVASTGCDGCYYYDYYDSEKCLNGLSCEIRGQCSPRVRTDKTSVIFKEVKT